MDRVRADRPLLRCGKPKAREIGALPEMHDSVELGATVSMAVRASGKAKLARRVLGIDTPESLDSDRQSELLFTAGRLVAE
jgi:hypothetical protein